MTCAPEILQRIPLFSLLDPDEINVLSTQVELKTFAIRQRIYKRGDPGKVAYILVSGAVRVTTVDEDNQDVLVSEPARGEFFGFASMLDETPHQTNALATEECTCIEIDRSDIAALLQQKPHAGLDLLTAVGRQLHATQELVRGRTARNPNDMIEDESSYGDMLADTVARFGGSWRFIILFGAILLIYTLINIVLGRAAWDPYPFILLNLFLSMLAAIQAPVIMMSQNRQDQKDRLRGELDYDVNRRSEFEIRALAEKLNLISAKIDDVQDLVRDQIAKR